MTNPHPIRRRAGPIVALALAAGCAGNGSAPVFDHAASLRRMATCDDLSLRLQETLLESAVGGYGYGYAVRGGVAEDDALDVGAPTSDAAGGDGDNGAEAPTDYSTTNVQEEDVDEIDIVKMADEGRLMVVAQDRALHLVRTFPADAVGKLATLPLDGWAQGLFVVGDLAVVTMQPAVDKLDEGGRESAPDSLGERWDVTRVLVVDIKDPAAPKVKRTLDVQGYVADARMVDGTVYLVLNQYMDVWSQLDLQDEEPPQLPEQPWESNDPLAWEVWRQQAKNVLRPYVERAFEGVDVASLLPQWRPTAGAAAESMYDCSDIYVPQPYTDLAMLSVVQLDARSGDAAATGLMANGWTVYASTENLYVAQSSRWWWGWEDDGASHVHKFRLGGDEPAYVGSGAVDGWLYDQFAMSEHEGFLRVVTTDSWWSGGFGVGVDVAEPAPSDEPTSGGSSSSGGGSDGDSGGSDDEAPEASPDAARQERPEPANNVFVLEDEGDGELVQVGHVGGIAPGETVQAVRMMGDKGYVVTFRQTDPLFTMDLSDPTRPRVVGELKMPGFSSYLHPLGDGHLIGVGRDGNEDGNVFGLAVNIFDVRDLSKPSLRHQLVLDEPGRQGWSWSWSEALWDHHAFTLHRGVLTIPASMETYDENTGRWDGFAGTVSFLVDPDAGVAELGRVDHADLVHESECLYERWYDWDVYGSCGWDEGWWGSAQVRRSVVVEDVLFTVSSYGVKANELGDPDVSVADPVLFYPAN
ncbi:MAG: beta-propeller domain-containing protein [Alphaproteobacteria bacterium]|nr:beta-propeller domain-containing protein [Alphaproteobacteria bacterium]